MQNSPILLAEDRNDDQVLVKRAIRKEGIENPLVVASDGTEAFDLMFGNGGPEGPITPALVLLDIKMPRVDGFEVLERIRADQRTSRIPVVMMTSSDEERDLARSYDLGANSYVRKPVDFSQFADAISMISRYWLCLNRAA